MEHASNLTDGQRERFSQAQSHALTVVACVATTLVATPLLGYLDLANIVMLFLLTVLVVAVRLGRNPAILASVLSVLLFDVFFVPPRFSLAVSNIQYLVTFAVMLATALTTAHLAAGLRQQALAAALRERRTNGLYQVARQLAGCLTYEQVADIAAVFLRSQLAARSVVLLPDDATQALIPAATQEPLPVDKQLAIVAYERGEPVGRSELHALGFASLYLPLRASMRMRGVLAVRFEDLPGGVSGELNSLLEALASLVAIALERLHYVEVAKAAEVKALTERLRSSILSALSHDLRTPLTAMVGLADSLSLIKPPLPPTALETAQAIHEQASSLAGLVVNLLEMARLNTGEVTLRKEWQPLEEVIGASIKLLGGALAEHPVKVALESGLPLLEFDAVLIERVFCNLLENAAKFSPDGCPIDVAATRVGNEVRVSVADRGVGFPPGRTEALFDMFAQGRPESGKPGMGLGLAICKAIVEAHGGRIGAANADGGACVAFFLPVGNPPLIEEENG